MCWLRWWKFVRKSFFVWCDGLRMSSEICLLLLWMVILRCLIGCCMKCMVLCDRCWMLEMFLVLLVLKCFIVWRFWCRVDFGIFCCSWGCSWWWRCCWFWSWSSGLVFLFFGFFFCLVENRVWLSECCGSGVEWEWFVECGWCWWCFWWVVCCGCVLICLCFCGCEFCWVWCCCCSLIFERSWWWRVGWFVWVGWLWRRLSFWVCWGRLCFGCVGSCGWFWWLILRCVFVVFFCWLGFLDGWLLGLLVVYWLSCFVFCF